MAHYGTYRVRGITGRLPVLATVGDDQALVDPVTLRPTLSVLVSERSGCSTPPVPPQAVVSFRYGGG